MKRALVAFTVTACVACAHRPPPITTSASTQLGNQLAAIRAAAQSGDLTAAQTRLAELRRAVADLQQQGDIRTDRAAAIITAAGDVAVQLSEATTTTTSTTTTTNPPEKHPRHGKGGDGGGNGGGQGGD